MACEAVRDNLSAYLDGELTAAEAAAVRDHVEACAECRELPWRNCATVDLLGGLGCCEAPAHLAEDVQQEIERRLLLAELSVPVDEAPQERLLPIHRVNPWPRILAAAATLVLVAGIGLLAYLGRPGPHLPKTSPRGETERARESVCLSPRKP